MTRGRGQGRSRSRDRRRSRSGDRRRRQRSPSTSSGTPSDSDRDNWASRSESGSSQGWENSDEEEKEQTTGEKVTTPEKDSFGPSLSKDEMNVMLGEAKRVDEKAVTLTINPALIDTFSKTLMGGGRWSRETWDDMEDKYRLSKEQQVKIDPPTLKRTKL